MDDAKALDCWGVAQSLGFTVGRGRRFGPCPSCQGAADRYGRPAVRVMKSNRWICNAKGGCHATGDVLDLVALRHFGKMASDLGSRFPRLQDVLGVECAEVSSEPVPEAPYADEGALSSILRASTPLHRGCEQVRAWAASRGLEGRLPAWVLPSSSWEGWAGVDFWPRWWADSWPVVVPAYSALGVLKGMHGRAISAHAPSKTRWAQGVSARGLVFADPWTALPGLRGEGWVGEGLVIAEGLTDFLSCAHLARPGAPHRYGVLGIESGSASAFEAMRLHPGDLVIATDQDEAGDRYAASITSALADRGRLPRRFHLR